MFGNEMKLMYETKFAIYCGRLCALSISSSHIAGKVVVTSASDVSILLHGQMDGEEFKRFGERLKAMLNVRTKDSSIIGIRIENVSEAFQLILDGYEGVEQLKIPLTPAKTEELNDYLMKCYVKQKLQNQSNLVKLESMSKQLQSKEYELENLKVRCEFQNKEIQLLRQLNSSDSKNNRKRRREDEEEEEVTSIDNDEEDDDEEEEEFKNVPLLRLLQTPSGKLVFEGNEASEDNGKEPSTSKTNNDEATTSVPDLMKKLGVIVRAPEGTSNLQIAKTPSAETGQLSKSPKKEMVVGVVQYVICQLCPEDEQKHTDIEQMEAHLMDKHVDKEKAQCAACPSDQFQPNNIVQHMKIHTNSVYACQHCGKRGRKNYLRSHIRTHTGERPYSCDTCSKSFTDSSTLRRHRLVHTGEKKYQCPVCGRAIARKDNVKVHIRSHGIQI